MDLSTATTLNNLGHLYKILGQNEKALDCYERDLNIQKKLSADNDYTLCVTYNNLGLVYKAMKEFDKAIYSFERSLYLRKKGPRNSDYQY